MGRRRKGDPSVALSPREKDVLEKLITWQIGVHGFVSVEPTGVYHVLDPARLDLPGFSARFSLMSIVNWYWSYDCQGGSLAGFDPETGMLYVEIREFHRLRSCGNLPEVAA